MKKALVALAACAFAPLAAAQPGSAYVAVSLGESRFDIECVTPLDCDDKDRAYTGGLGWQFNPYVAAEFAYTDLGQAELRAPGFGAHLHATAYELSAVGTYPIWNVFSLLGRLGVTRGETKYGGALGGEHKATGWTFGAGVQLDFTKNVAARFQFQRFNEFKSQIQRPTEEAQERGDVKMLSVGILLRAR